MVHLYNLSNSIWTCQTLPHVTKYSKVFDTLCMCMCVCVCVCVYIYIYIYIYIKRVIYKLQCGETCEMLQAEIGQISYLRAISVLCISEGIFYKYIMGYWECLILEKSYCVSAYVVAGKFPSTVHNPWVEGAHTHTHIQSSTDNFVVSQLFSYKDGTAG